MSNIRKKGILTILNVYKRPETLRMQIEALDAQTVPSDEYWIWYNASDKPKIDIPLNHPKVKLIDSSSNLKFHGRFAMALLSRYEYVSIMDDDMLPQKKWYENCMNSMKRKEGVYTSYGVILGGTNYTHNKKIGWGQEYPDRSARCGYDPQKIQRCDLAGQNWFFKADWAKYMWYENPYSWDNGEDIHFAYMCQKYGNVNFYVAPHPTTDLELWGTTRQFSMKWGTDSNATYLTFSDHKKIRNEMCEKYIKDGWKLTLKQPKSEQLI